MEVFGFYLGDTMSLRLCENCYKLLKAEMFQDVLKDLIGEFAAAINRVNFTKR